MLYVWQLIQMHWQVFIYVYMLKNLFMVYSHVQGSDRPILDPQCCITELQRVKRPWVADTQQLLENLMCMSHENLQCHC